MAGHASILLYMYVHGFLPDRCTSTVLIPDRCTSTVLIADGRAHRMTDVEDNLCTITCCCFIYAILNVMKLICYLLLL